MNKAIERARKVLLDCTPEEQKVVEYIFPELTLEKATKVFLEALSETPYNNMPIVQAQASAKQLLMFLTDPKSYNPDNKTEQKSAEWSYDEGKQIQINPSDYINDMGGNGCYLKSTAQASAWSEKDKEYLNFIISIMKTLQVKCTENDIKRHSNSQTAPYYGKVIDWLKSLKPQPKQEWNGGDDAHLHSIITHLQDFIESHPNTTGADIQGENVAWLKSLKDRVQPKQEWSKEDEDAIGMAIIALDDMYNPDAPSNTYVGYSMPFNKAVERLKSLRHHKQWKPSEEQMHYLYWIANIKLGASVVEQEVSKHLNELYEQLKQL